MWRALIAVPLLVSACASLGPLTDGSAPGLIWHTADAGLTRRSLDTRSWWEYSFSLVVKETQGLSVSLSCPHVAPNCGGPNVPIPLWRITMVSRSAAGEPIRYVIDLRMPADPPSPAATTAASIRAISLTAPRAPEATGSTAADKK
jgi:hypothetical protein